MANDLGNPLGFFFGNDTSDPRVNQQLRQKIALAMMARESKYPKNLGEGLSAIGDAIAQRHMMQSLLQGDLAQQDAAAKLGAAPSSPQAVAEPDATPPAVAAINRAITPATPQQPLETPLTGDEQKAGVSPGDYNVLDAQANLGFKPTPGYMQDAIAAKESNPDMQAYYGSLSGSEAKNAQDVSPTGAAGPYQFTRGTAAQYGIPGAARQDPAASTDAVRKLTADNAATFARINGRTPSFQELALMHQQGGTTGAQMAAGTGNALPGNLAVNNIPPGASPAQAVGKINSFYGMPNAPAPVNQRDAIAGQLVQQQGGPAPSPPVAGPDQRLALAAPAGVTGLRPAPPVPPQVRAPPVQVAQNAPQPTPVPGYVPPQAAMPTAADAPIIQPGRREMELNAVLAQNRNNPYAAQSPAALELQKLQEDRAKRQSAADEIFKSNIAQTAEQKKLREQALMDQDKRIADADHIRQQTATGRLIDPSDKNMVLGPDGVARPLKVEGQDASRPPNVGNLTEPQQKLLVFHGWAGMGNDQMKGNDQLLAHGLQEEMLGKIPFAGNALQSAEYRRARNAANNFVLAFMRDTSGAAYGAKEMYDHASALLPKVGDDAKTLADKAAQRDNFVQTLYGGLGKAQPMADWLAKQRGDEEQNKQRVLDIEMQGVPKVQGEVKTNKKTGAKRVWNGSNWVEM